MKKQQILRLLAVVVIICTVSYSVNAARYMENLDRGVVAVDRGGGQVYIGWRMFGTDPETIGFNIYRDSVKINAALIAGTTNYIDTAGSTSSTYSVAPVIDGIEEAASTPVGVWGQQYLTVPLQVPAGVTTPDGVTCSYSPNDASVGDLDGDGEYEIVLKWDPSNSRDNAWEHRRYTGNVYLDAYEMDGTFLWRIDLGINIAAGAHYTQFIVYDLDSDGRAEVACRTAPYTVDGLGNYVLLPGDVLADYRTSDGYILTGPEYLTVFDGQTGATVANTEFYPDRVDVSQWGDGYGNRVDRFLAGVAYLDGQRPSLIMARGYYGPQSGYSARNEITAWNWRDGELTRIWWFKAGLGINDDINSEYIGQGNHNLSIGDVDGDGFDEIMYGACAVDHDGTGMYSTGYGHGDAMHMSDLDPSRPGLEVFTIHEGSGPGSTFRDANTGEILWETDPGDVGRGLSADIDANYAGYECWGFGGLRSCTGTLITDTNPPGNPNFAVWWDDDLTRELLDEEKIDKWHPEYNSDGGGSERLLTAYNYGADAINGSKANPCLQADILGDWREEVIWRHYDNTKLLIFTTTIPTNYRFYTFMHDPQYRVSVAWQNTAYNQPPHTGFFMGDGMSDPPTPDIVLVDPLTLYGDFTGDLRVDMDDLPYFMDLWLEDNCTLTAELDLNEDCLINFLEFSTLAGNWSPDTTPPLAPTGLSAAAGNETVLLDWNDSPEDDLDGYNVYRSETAGSGYTLLNTSLLSSSDYIDADVVNGTTYYYVITATDTHSNESAPSSEASAAPDVLTITTIQIQENEPGFVDVVEGTIDTNHTGYTGSGFANTNNEAGQYIEWTVQAPQAGTYDLQWRFANGSDTGIDRTGEVSVNGGTQATNISFDITGNWDTWSLSAVVPVSLSQGTNTIRLIAETDDGLANIDWIEVTGLFP